MVMLHGILPGRVKLNLEPPCIEERINGTAVNTARQPLFKWSHFMILPADSTLDSPVSRF